MKKTNILIFTEDVLAFAKKFNIPSIPEAYPNGLYEAIAGAFDGDKYTVSAAGVENVTETITPEILEQTDVLIWWGHAEHHLVPDHIAELVAKEVQKGMGFIALHSAHLAKPFTRLT